MIYIYEYLWKFSWWSERYFLQKQPNLCIFLSSLKNNFNFFHIEYIQIMTQIHDRFNQKLDIIPKQWKKSLSKYHLRQGNGSLLKSALNFAILCPLRSNLYKSYIYNLKTKQNHQYNNYFVDITTGVIILFGFD